MLINFTIQNFASIREKVTLSFEATNSNDLEKYYIHRVEAAQKKYNLLKLGLIYGANASGKTTILKALDFLRDMVTEPLEKKTETLDFKPFMFDERSRNENSNFVIEFLQNKVKYVYEVEFNNKMIVTETLYFYNPNKAIVFRRETLKDKLLTKIAFGSKIKLNKEHKNILEANTLSNNTVLGGYLKTNIDSFELKEVNDWFEKKLKPMIRPQTDLLSYVSSKLEVNEIKKNNVIEILQKADFNISDIIFNKEKKEIPSELLKLLENAGKDLDEGLLKIKETGIFEATEIIFKHSLEEGGQYSLAYLDESAGTQRYYQLGGLLDIMFRSEAVFPIDELEASIHPDLYKHFLLTFLTNCRKSQLIATTHHRELLLERDIFRNDVIWFTEKSKEEYTDLFSLADFDTSVIRDTSSVYNAYKTGKLGATPDMQDYYINLENE